MTACDSLDDNVGVQDCLISVMLVRLGHFCPTVQNQVAQPARPKLLLGVAFT
jgi:hypothetical protein